MTRRIYGTTLVVVGFLVGLTVGGVIFLRTPHPQSQYAVVEGKQDCLEIPGSGMVVASFAQAYPKGRVFHLQKPMSHDLEDCLKLAPGVEIAYIPFGTRYQISIQKAEAFTWEQVMEGIGWELK